MGWAAAAQGGGAVLGAIGQQQAIKAQNQAQALQQRQADMNLKSQNDRDNTNYVLTADHNKDERGYRDMLLTMMKEGYDDPTHGVSTRYTPGRGNVTSYTPQAAALVQGDQRENLLRLVDQQISRRGRSANELRRNKEGAAANSVMGEMESPDPYNDKRIVADLIARNRAGVNEGFDKTLQGALTSNIRTGSSSDNLIAKMARERSGALRDAEAGGYTEGLSTANSLRGDRTSRLGNLYSLLATRAANQDDVAFSPQTLSASGQQAAFARNPASAGQAVLTSPNMRATTGQYDLNAIKAPYQPMSGMAKSLSGMADLFDDDRTNKSQGVR